MAVVVVDYGMGNLWSVLNAVRHLGFAAEASADPEAVRRAETLILPGVGSFRAAMEALRARELDEALRQAVRGKGQRLLGICLGMQLLAEHGTEEGDTEGLGLLPATVDRFRPAVGESLKVPHIGFSEVQSPSDSTLFRGIGSPADFYFVHSYRITPGALPGASSLCTHGETFLAAYEHENLFATQFHPEKSQANGLLLLRNFLTA